MYEQCITIEIKPYKGCRIEKDTFDGHHQEYYWYDKQGRIHMSEEGEGFRTLARVREDISTYLGC